MRKFNHFFILHKILASFKVFSVLNHVVLIGNLGSDPEVRVLESGVKFVRFSIATNEVFVGGDGVEREHTEWHTVQCWRGVADYVHTHLRCGAKCRVEGRIRSYTSHGTKLNPEQHRVFEILANSVQLLVDDSNRVECPKGGGVKGGGSEKPATETPVVPSAPVDVDGLPF